MKTQEAAHCLAELGNVTRLQIYRLLVKAGKNGLSVGDIQLALNIPGSTLSHHIRRLAKVKLIEQNKAGRTIFCKSQYNKLQEIIDFLVDKCCEGEACLEKTKISACQ
jgi:DNA-binding transcriptional ArsR family regulator